MNTTPKPEGPPNRQVPGCLVLLLAWPVGLLLIVGTAALLNGCSCEVRFDVQQEEGVTHDEDQRAVQASERLAS